MLDFHPKRKHLEEKEAFHNAIISVPFFVSQTPTKIIAVKKQHPSLTHPQPQEKIYYDGRKFVKTKILSFASVEEAKEYHAQYCSLKDKDSWLEYCKDISNLEGILYHYGKMYVPWFESRQLRDFLNDTSQLVVFHGLFMEQHLKRTGNPLFRFLDHKALSLEYIYYRWRAYAYLQNDGQKRYRTDPFRMIDGGLEWIPPMPSTLQRGILTYKQRRHFSQLLGKLTRKKQDIAQAMVFAISYIGCAIEVACIITIEIFEKINEDFVKYFYLISDILFNTTTEDYRRLFSRVIPLALYKFSKPGKERETKLRGQLKALIQLWEIKFIFDENYTKGLLFLLSQEQNNVRGIHPRLKAIGSLEDDEQSQYQLQKTCFENGIPFIEGEKEESTRLINEYLWQNSKQDERPPQISESVDGEPISQKDLMKIRNKQVKVVTCQNLSVSILLQRNWQTKSRAGQSSSVNNE